MKFFLLALLSLLGGGIAAVVAGRRASWTMACGVGGALIGCLLGLVPALGVLITGAPLFLRVRWDVPYGEFALRIDPLAAFFLMIIFGLSLVCAVYGGDYLRTYRDRKSLGPCYAWFNVLVASMALAVAAHNAILFLMAWEIMSLASFFLVTFEDEKADVRAAGWTYLIAMHLGTAFLLFFFALLGRQAGSLDFEKFQAMGPLPPALAAMLFVLALIGFGTKAGFVPLHVWLPEAHPAAPTHVSALMSGVMIKLGIYGILRAITFLGPEPLWWGLVLIFIGVTSGVLGVMFALAQHDLKKLLAYSSIENIGIIALGIGIGLIGKSCGNTLVSALGFAGALLHVLHHGLFKGLLFLAAGSVVHASGTRQIDRMGGLLKPMPWTGGMFLVGSVAICGLPPLNGFVSEWLIYGGSFWGIVGPCAPNAAGGMLACIVALAMIGALAAACFAKAFGTVFLGMPRTKAGHGAHELGPAMAFSMGILAIGCLALGLWPAGALALVTPVAAFAMGSELSYARGMLQGTRDMLMLISIAAAVFLLLVLLLAILRRGLLAKRQTRQALTWDCGFAAPTARMQYTSSSFAKPLTDLFHGVLWTQMHEESPAGYFPPSARLASHTPDIAKDYGFRPLFREVARILEKMRWLQQGRVQLYLLYLFLTLLALLIWKFGIG